MSQQPGRNSTNSHKVEVFITDSSDGKVEKIPGGPDALKFCNDGNFSVRSPQVRNFVARKSPLSNLLLSRNHTALYGMMVALLAYHFVYSMIKDLEKYGRTYFGLLLVFQNLNGISIALFMWLIMKFSTILLYFVFLLWTRQRPNKNGRVGMWDSCFLFLLVSYELGFVLLPCLAVIKANFPTAVSLALLMEQMRLLMKQHCYIRSNVPCVISGRTEFRFSQYVYFLFAPTLIYKHTYPRTDHIRWRVVLQHFAEVGGVIFFFSFIMQLYLWPSMEEIINSRWTFMDFLLLLVRNVLPATLGLLVGFFGLLHAWQNAFAEILCFADRLFYKDWWNASSFSEYFKKWNLIVHDWLYAYVYLDTQPYVCKNGSTILVFLISAFFHEYCLAVTFRFFYPVLFMIFGVLGSILVFLPEKVPRVLGNILVWISLAFGMAVVITLYMVEFNARRMCPSKTDSAVKDFFIPRSWNCNATSRT